MTLGRGRGDAAEVHAPGGGWSVQVEAAGAINDDELSALAAHLPDGVSYSGKGHFGARFSVGDAATPGAAAVKGERSFVRACTRVTGKAPLELRRAEVVRYDVLDADNREPQLPEMVGVAEVAAMLGVSRQRVSALTRSHGDFPAPLIELAAGPVWLRSAIESFEERWERRPGRKAS